jgi:hypothetical protein
MTRGPALPCPACKRSYEALDWFDANHCRCRKCQEDFDFFPFPALVATKEIAKPQAVAVAEDSTCFFHAQNQAEKVCDGCGRFLCAVCAVPFAGKTMCPNCIANSKKDDVRLVASRPVPGRAAFWLAVLPMVFCPLLFLKSPEAVAFVSLFLVFTFVTAPLALFLAVGGWRKPPSLVRPSRWPLYVGGLIAVLQVGGWIFVGVSLILKA